MHRISYPTLSEAVSRPSEGVPLQGYSDSQASDMVTRQGCRPAGESLTDNDTQRLPRATRQALRLVSSLRRSVVSTTVSGVA
jgi:hypothetical protein